MHFLTAAELTTIHHAGLTIIDNKYDDSSWGRHRLAPPQSQGLVLEGTSKASFMLYSIPFTNREEAAYVDKTE